MVNEREKNCTCRNRALARNERVEYIVPRGHMFEGYVFAKDCPVHGYSVIEASDGDKEA